MAYLVVLLLLGSCSLSSTSEVEDYVAPRYIINLDLPPEQRWEEVLQNFNITELKINTEKFSKFSPYQSTKPILCFMADIYLDFYAQEDPYAGEMRGIAKTTGMRTCEVVILNLLYETIMACTSIITEDKEGNIYHGRNMDMFFSDVLKQMTVDVDFIKNGKIVYTGTTFVGYVGLMTGQSPYKFTISANAREENNVLWKNALSLLMNRPPFSWLIRNVLNEAPDYQSAVSLLSDTPLTAEIYLIVAGTKPGEGAVITRNRGGAADVLHLNASNGRWFLLQTNDDRWQDTSVYDKRRIIGTSALNATGQENINNSSLYTVLSTPKVLNRITIHTTMMSAASPQDYVSRIRVIKDINLIPGLYRVPLFEKYN